MPKKVWEFVYTNNPVNQEGQELFTVSGTWSSKLIKMNA